MSMGRSLPCFVTDGRKRVLWNLTLQHFGLHVHAHAHAVVLVRGQDNRHVNYSISHLSFLVCASADSVVPTAVSCADFCVVYM